MACQVNHDPALKVDEPAIIPQPVKVKLEHRQFSDKKSYCCLL